MVRWIFIHTGDMTITQRRRRDNDSSFSEQKDIWIRLPKPGTRCTVSGLSRTSLNDLIAEGKIAAKHLKKRGALRGIVLIDRKSLIDYINSLPEVGHE